MNFDFLNLPDIDYGGWDFGLIAASIAAIFLFLYIMQGRIVDSIVAALVLGVVVSFIAIVFFQGNEAFWLKYLLITIAAPVGIAIILKAIPRIAGASRGIGSKKSMTTVGKKPQSRNTISEEKEWDSTQEKPLRKFKP